jgi:hypothetical protein
MRARLIAVVIVAAAAIGIGAWRPWRDAAPAPEDETANTDTNASAAAAPPAPAPPPLEAVPPATDAGPDPARGPRLPVARLAARDAGAATPDGGDERRARFRAMHQAMSNATPDAARLYASFVRLRMVAPAEAMTLVEMKQQGVPQDQLVAYVKQNFHDLAAQGIALRWLGVGGGAAAGEVRPDGG